MCGTDDDAIEDLKKLGQYAYEAMLALPEMISTKPKRYDSELKGELNVCDPQTSANSVVVSAALL